MVDIQSKEVIDKMSDELKVQPSMALPRRLSDSIQPVFEVGNPKVNTIVETASKGGTGTGTVFTVPTGVNFYLTSCYFTYACDVVCDSTAYQLKITPIGKAEKNLINFRKNTLTKQDALIYPSYANGIQLEPGSLVTITHTFTVGVSNIVGGVIGYTTDPQ